jgi:hypothetical protein
MCFHASVGDVGNIYNSFSVIVVKCGEDIYNSFIHSILFVSSRYT